MATTNIDDNVTVMTHDDYDCAKPYVYAVDYNDTMTSDGLNPTTVPTPQPEYERMPSDKRHKPKFCMPDGVPTTVEALSEMAIPDWFVKETTKNSNAYCKAQKKLKKKSTALSMI